MIFEGTYRSLFQGVSQQTPQERLDGQLGAQVNMLSDPVNGLRRRTGFKLHGGIDVPPESKFDLVQLGGEYYIQVVTPDGRLVIVRFSDMMLVHDSQYPYLVHNAKGSIRSTLSRNQCFILNTEQVPNKVLDPVVPVVPINSADVGWVYLQSGTAPHNTGGIDVTVAKAGMVTQVAIGRSDRNLDLPYTVILDRVYNNMLANSVLTSNFTITKVGSTIALRNKTLGSGAVTVTATKVNLIANTLVFSVSGSSHTVSTRKDLPPNLPSTFNKYAPYVNTTRYLYDATRKVWTLFKAEGANLNPKGYGWIRIMSGAFSKAYTVSIAQGARTVLTFTVTTHTSTAAEATPEYVATQLETQMNANGTFSGYYSVVREGTVLAIISNNTTDQLVLTGSSGEVYINTSGGSLIANKDLLPPTLPIVLDGYIQGVGTASNTAYYQFNYAGRSWKESGTYEARYTIQNTPMFWYFDYEATTVVVDSLDIQGRTAGDDNNNPEPAFLGFGITGISAYQSRLILLSGAYVCMSKSTDPTVFMRSTVTEVLDDDPIEISATALSNSQFEYAVPYNKDLILFSSTQQAVIPASNAVLTPKSAVIYPSTQAEVSLAVRPTVAARSLYYVYQRGLDYYQAGELIPNQYTDAQYYPQNLTDHLPLYATGVCTGMAGSSTNNMVAFSSDSPEVLINQFVWQGDQRSIMGFHKWVLPRAVMDVAFLQEYNILFVADTDGKTLVLTTNTQLNQLRNKPVPFLDIYQYVETDADGKGTLQYVPEGDLVGVVYDEISYRHMEIELDVDSNGNVQCNHTGTIAVGLRYDSSFTLTPPYLKDEDGKILAGVKSTVHSFPMTFKGTGEFQYQVHDFLGNVATVDTSAATWSEVNLGYTWINSVGTSVIPVRSRLDGLTCTVRTTSTTDLNLTTAGYVLRTAQKHRRGR